MTKNYVSAKREEEGIYEVEESEATRGSISLPRINKQGAPQLNRVKPEKNLVSKRSGAGDSVVQDNVNASLPSIDMKESGSKSYSPRKDASASQENIRETNSNTSSPPTKQLSQLDPTNRVSKHSLKPKDSGKEIPRLPSQSIGTHGT